MPTPASVVFGEPPRRRFAVRVLHPRLSEDHIDVKLLADLRVQIDHHLPPSSEPVDLDVWLESPGGHGDAAYRIALLLSGRATTLRVVVANSARSAATLLSLAADEIFMSDDAELGPLDAQISHANGVTSARDVVRNLELIQQQAVKLANTGAHSFRDDFSLPAAEALTPAAALASSLIEALITRVDPSLIFDANNLLNATERYAKRLLQTPYQRHQRKPTLNEQEEIIDIATRLVRTFPTHDFVIDRTEAYRLGLHTRLLDDYPQRDDVIQALHDARRGGAATLQVHELDPMEAPARWRDQPTARSGDRLLQLPDLPPGAGPPPPRSGDLADYPDYPEYPGRPGQVLHGGRRTTSGLDGRSEEEPRRNRRKMVATLPRQQSDHGPSGHEVDLDDAWIWGLAPRPASGPASASRPDESTVHMTEPNFSDPASIEKASIEVGNRG